MSLVKWQPIERELMEMSRLMNRFLGGGLADWQQGADDLGAWSPRVNIFESDGNIVVEAELPGIVKEEMDIRVENNLLVLRGERKIKQEVKEEDYYRSEMSRGSFARSFTLPTTVDMDHIDASYQDGILTVTLPKVEEARPKSIPIK